MGGEFAGVIEQIGAKVKNFRVGDKVFGYNDSRFGAQSEYMVLNENDSLAIMP